MKSIAMTTGMVMMMGLAGCGSVPKISFTDSDRANFKKVYFRCELPRHVYLMKFSFMLSPYMSEWMPITDQEALGMCDAIKDVLAKKWDVTMEAVDVDRAFVFDKTKAFAIFDGSTEIDVKPEKLTAPPDAKFNRDRHIMAKKDAGYVGYINMDWSARPYVVDYGLLIGDAKREVVVPTVIYANALEKPQYPAKAILTPDIVFYSLQNFRIFEKRHFIDKWNLSSELSKTLSTQKESTVSKVKTDDKKSLIPSASTRGILLDAIKSNLEGTAEMYVKSFETTAPTPYRIDVQN